jgi:hypothetical protein
MSENPFKQNPLDKECRYLYISANRECYFFRDESMNIIKYNPSNKPFTNEIQIYLMLLEKQMFANISARNNNITYMVSNMISVRSYLDSLESIKYGIVLNELFCFVNTFQTFQYVHGNLNIDNIFVELYDHNPSTIKFRLIDLEKSTISSLHNYKDFYTLQNSLTSYFNKNTKPSLIMYLKNIVARYTKSVT